MNTDNSANFKLGMIMAVVSQVTWAVMPIYWKSLEPIDSIIVILYRIVLVAVVSFFVSLAKNPATEILARLKDWHFMKIPILAGIFVTVNWSIYIWAVNAGMIVQTSIGYYIEPLIVCSLGVIIFKEKMTKHKVIALSFAFLGVLAIIIYYGKPPIVALGLAFSFAIYAAMKKKFAISPVLSLFYETIYIVPIALGVIIYLEVTGQGAIASGAVPYQFVLLAGVGLATMIPLGCFAYAAMNIPLITVGLSGYFAPTMALFIGVWMYGESFKMIEVISFGIIWIGLAVFTRGQFIIEAKERTCLHD